jgi:hypothetical protein
MVAITKNRNFLIVYCDALLFMYFVFFCKKKFQPIYANYAYFEKKVKFKSSTQKLKLK